MRVSSTLLCSAKSSGMHSQSPSAPELEDDAGTTAPERGPQAALLWRHLRGVPATELATTSTSLWAPLATMWYTLVVGAQRPKPRAARLPWMSCQCCACKGILPSPHSFVPGCTHLPPLQGQSPASIPAAAQGRECVGPVPTSSQGLPCVLMGVLKKVPWAYLRFLCQACSWSSRAVWRWLW